MAYKFKKISRYKVFGQIGDDLWIYASQSVTPTARKTKFFKRFSCMFVWRCHQRYYVINTRSLCVALTQSSIVFAKDTHTSCRIMCLFSVQSSKNIFLLNKVISKSLPLKVNKWLQNDGVYCLVAWQKGQICYQFTHIWSIRQQNDLME